MMKNGENKNKSGTLYEQVVSNSEQDNDKYYSKLTCKYKNKKTNQILQDNDRIDICMHENQYVNSITGI